MAATIGSGIREALLWACNEGKTVTTWSRGASITGRVLKVIPLVIEQADKSGMAVINLDTVDMVQLPQAPAERVLQAVTPQAETRFMGASR